MSECTPAPMTAERLAEIRFAAAPSQRWLDPWPSVVDELLKEVERLRTLIAEDDESRARRAIIGLGWESELSQSDLDKLSPTAMRHVIEILAPVSGDARVDQLGAYATKIMERRLAALVAVEEK